MLHRKRAARVEVASERWINRGGRLAVLQVHRYGSIRVGRGRGRFEEPRVRVQRTGDGSEMVGTVSIHTGYSVPVERVRQKLTEIVRLDRLGDGHGRELAGHRRQGRETSCAQRPAREPRRKRGIFAAPCVRSSSPSRSGNTPALFWQRDGRSRGPAWVAEAPTRRDEIRFRSLLVLQIAADGPQRGGDPEQADAND
jgi:hypothetical protein